MEALMKLRPYQCEAVQSVYDHLRSRDDNPCVVIPTGGGKTPVIATICSDAVNLWGGRVVILAHVRELLEQAADKLRAIAPDVPLGIYSAGLKRKDLGYAVTIAGIQSIYQRACDLGPVDLVIVDEAHLIPPDGEGMYRQFIAEARVVNPHVRVIGLTATPYRMKTGTICSPDNILNEVCFEIGVRELIVQGYLAPLRTKAGSAKADTSDLHIRGGEFVAGEVEDLMDTDALVDAACAEIVEQTGDRSSVLIFCAGVRHGEHVARVLRERHGVECGFVCGETPAKERDELIARFRAGGEDGLRFLANVNVLTTGFDATNVDCVAMLRPTLSPGLYYQMVGRGFRPHPGKADCLVLDFGGNVLRHGPVDAIRVRTPDSGDGEAPAKECPQCAALIHAAYAACPECGHEFPDPDTQKHAATASGEGILSDQVSRWEERVSEVTYHIHRKRDDPTGEAPPTMRVEYRCGFNTYHREWVCIEHSEYARRKAEAWWRARSNEPVPETVEDAVDMAEMGALAETLRITVEKKAGEKWERVVDHELGDVPPRLESEEGLPALAPSTRTTTNDWDVPDDEIPF
ncbi:MAG: DEAD/DEAH box helicase [Phycisphaeraceae bacterium]|nr:MAG: DEAD/DEAH box helicase [Phycisphaeraceae bacterium]